MFDDFKELLSIFNALNVKYLIVGGYAVSLHAQPRATKDIDILIKPDPGNAKAVYTALARFGAPLEGLTAEDFREPGKFFRMGQPPYMIDIPPEINRVDFDPGWQRRGKATGYRRRCRTPQSRAEPDRWYKKAKLAAERPQADPVKYR